MLNAERFVQRATTRRSRKARVENDRVPTNYRSVHNVDCWRCEEDVLCVVRCAWCVVAGTCRVLMFWRLIQKCAAGEARACCLVSSVLGAVLGPRC